MDKPITATELGRNLAEYLNRVTYRGESFVVQRGGRPVAVLRPAHTGTRGADFLARWRTLPHLTPEEADDLARDIEEARQELNRTPLVDPWDS